MASPILVGCAVYPCRGHMVQAIDINPLHWLGDAASAAVGDVWQAAMTALWSAALWLLRLAFLIIDEFSTPDLSAAGPMSALLPTTLWLGATLAVLMLFVQLMVAVVRRDGQSLGRLFLGVAQFGFAWIAYLGVAAGLVAAASGLEKGILSSMVHVDALSGIDLSASWPNKLADATSATVLGVLSLLLVIPAAFAYLLIMFVREAALIVLVATAPITIAGLLHDTAKAWFWKTLRWFFACLLISPLAALVLGVGVKLANGVITAPGARNLSGAQSVGEAVVGCVVIAIGACCPLVLFRLLGFVDPGTASGAALRQSWSDAGGMSGLLSAGKQQGGSSAATRSSGDGRSGGETAADSQTQSRLMGMLGPVGQALQTGTSMATGVAHRAADIGSDVLGQTGIGSPGYSPTPTDESAARRTPSRPPNGVASDGPSGGGQSPSDGPNPAPAVPPTAPNGPSQPFAPAAPNGAGTGSTGAGGAGAGGAAGGVAAGEEAAAAAVIL